jgi:hypothetical protein
VDPLLALVSDDVVVANLYGTTSTDDDRFLFDGIFPEVLFVLTFG